MKMSARSRSASAQTMKLVYIAILTALVVVLQTVAIVTGSFTGLSVNLSIVPIVVGAAMCGKLAGGWLGFVSGLVVLFDPSTMVFLTFNPFATVVLCLLKGTMSGFLAGLVYTLLEKKNKLLAGIIAAIVAPVTNTSIFVLGCITIFYDLVVGNADFGAAFAGLLAMFISLNFIIELLSSLVLSPTVVRIIEVKRK